MVRPALHLHPARTPAPMRLAASLLLLRDGAHGLEVLMTRRSHQASFAASAHVFPGGAVDEADAQAHALAAPGHGHGPEALTHALAAIRETWEELGILLARDAQGRVLQAADLGAIDRQAPLYPQCAERRWTLAADLLRPLARWIAALDIPKRFDTPFFVAEMPEAQQAEADGQEQFEPVWVRPAEALRRHAEGEFLLIYPTVRTLERLQAYAQARPLLDACRDAPLWVSCPRAGLLAGREMRQMEHEPGYGELALVCPDGQPLHDLQWQHERPVPLLRHVQRLTAPNPGTMTGPGTNSYLVGNARAGHVVIDPGPADPDHLERLWQAAEGRIRAILCTHSHPDHAPGAPALQALCVGRDGSRPPVRGMASTSTARADSRFAPDEPLADGDLISWLAPTHANDSDPPRITLLARHTPGHTGNHLCFLLLEDGLLFSGDHVLSGTTPIINPPDGHMGDYLASLERLMQDCAAHGVDFILPAHGHVMHDAPAVLARLKTHRLQREARVRAAMQTLPEGRPADWVRLAYTDVPEALWPLAERSLLAHVAHLRGE